jgi:hypothetical protein
MPVRPEYSGSGSINVEYKFKPDGCRAVLRLEDLDRHEAACARVLSPISEFKVHISF